MKSVELYAQVRYAVQIEGVSRREAARRYGIDPRTVAKMLAFSVPPGYRRSRPPARPKLDSFTGIIDAILAADEARPKKQRHTAKRIFERPYAAALWPTIPAPRTRETSAARRLALRTAAAELDGVARLLILSYR